MSEMWAERVVDRTDWPKGEWDGEPDKLLWKHKGFDCAMVRNGLGSLCGYVGVKVGHPWFGKKYNDVNADAHGGLTFGEYDKLKETFWVGFDCAHSGDVSPGMQGMEKYSTWRSTASTYKDAVYVKAEVNALADQAFDAAFPTPTFKEE